MCDVLKRNDTMRKIGIFLQLCERAYSQKGYLKLHDIKLSSVENSISLPHRTTLMI